MIKQARPLAVLLALTLCASGLGMDAAQAAKKGKAPEDKKVSVPVSPDVLKQLDPSLVESLNKLSEGMHWEDRSIYQELRDEEEGAVTDIGMLWQAAVERSGTIRYAIEKLSRRDATGEPVADDGFSKRMLQSLVRLGGVAGSMYTGTPAGLIGGGMVEDLMGGNPQESALMRVTDADMVLLAKEVEALQSQIIEHYYAYRHARERLNVTREATLTIGKYYDHASSLADAGNPTQQSLQPLMQSMYESAKQEELSAEQAVASARNSLMLMVGPDAVAALDSARKSARQ